MAIAQVEDTRQRTLPQPQKSNNSPVLERNYTTDELKQEVASVARTRKVIMGAVWTIAVAVMIYGMVNVTPFLIDHGVNPFIAPGLPLMVDVALAVSLWGDKMMRRYDMKDGWITTLRWGSALITWALNIAHPLSGTSSVYWKPDWVGVLVHSCGPIMLILVTEAANSFSRKTTSIMQTLSKAETDKVEAESTREDALATAQAQLTARTAELDQARAALNEVNALTENSRSVIEMARSSTERLEGLILNRSNVATKELMGQSIVSHFSAHQSAQMILSEDETTGNERADRFGKRVMVCRTGVDTLILADSADKVVRHAMEGVDPAEGIARIPSSSLVTLRDSDLGNELTEMLREKGALKSDDYFATVKAIRDGNVSELSENLISRVVIRAYLETRES